MAVCGPLGVPVCLLLGLTLALAQIESQFEVTSSSWGHYNGSDVTSPGGPGGLRDALLAHGLRPGEGTLAFLRRQGYADQLSWDCWEVMLEDGLIDLFYDHQEELHISCICYLYGCDEFAEEAFTEEEHAQRVAEMERLSSERASRQFEGPTQTVATVEVVAYSLVIGFGALGNILVLFTVSRFMKRPSVTYIFVCSIASSDLLVNLYAAPYQLFARFTKGTRKELHSCRFAVCFFYYSFACSVFSLLAMSVERYFVICHPMKAQVVSTPGRAKKIVVAIWILSFAAAAPFTYFTTAFTTCSVMWRFVRLSEIVVILLAMFLYVIPVVVMIYAYVRISVTLWNSVKTARKLKSGNLKMAAVSGAETDKKPDDSSGRIQVIKMLITVLVVFVITWSPFWIHMFLEGIRYYDNTPLTGMEASYISTATRILAFLSTCINPILYAFSSRPLREGFVDMMRHCVGRPAKYAKDMTSSRNLTASSAVSRDSIPSVSA